MVKGRTAANACVVSLLLVLLVAAVRADLPESALASSFMPGVANWQKRQSLEDLRVRAEAVVPRVPGQLYGEHVEFHRLKPLPPQLADEETLWLARCIFSETKRPSEQELVAWVIRNRVETSFRGKNTYRDVVLDPMQFSAFNINSGQREFYLDLGPLSRVPGWQTALRIAYDVRWADSEWRPFSANTRHFYSEQSMTGRSHPDWARGYEPVSPERDFEVEPHRFRFFADVM